MAEGGNGYGVSPKENDLAQDLETRKLKQIIEEYKESIRKLERKICRLNNRGELTPKEEEILHMFEDVHSRAHQQLR